MGASYEKTKPGFMTISEVKEYLGITYQSFKDELTPRNFDYSSNDSGKPKNLYSIDDVEVYEELYRYHQNKDRYTVRQVAKILNRSIPWVLHEIVPTDQVIRKSKTYTYYDKRLIKQYLDSKNGTVYPDSTQLELKIKVLESKISELELKLNSGKRLIKLSDVMKVLAGSSIEVEI